MSSNTQTGALTMPIDPRMVKWDDATPQQAGPNIDPRMVRWEDAEPAKGGIAQGAGNLVAGLLRGAGSIGATLLAPIDALARKLNGGQPINIGGYDIAGQDRRVGTPRRAG